MEWSIPTILISVFGKTKSNQYKCLISMGITFSWNGPLSSIPHSRYRWFHSWEWIPPVLLKKINITRQPNTTFIQLHPFPLHQTQKPAAISASPSTSPSRQKPKHFICHHHRIPAIAIIPRDPSHCRHRSQPSLASFVPISMSHSRDTVPKKKKAFSYSKEVGGTQKRRGQCWIWGCWVPYWIWTRSA